LVYREGLIDAILGSGDWEAIFDNIIQGGKRVASELQKSFNQTAAGLKELAAVQEAQAKASGRCDARYESSNSRVN
jgi:hypothetical protein